MSGKRAGIRWRDDGWELRCDSCAKLGRTTSYWPLTDEFWDRRATMARCRACTRIAKNRRDRERYARDMALQARKRAYSVEYRVEAARGIKVTRSQHQPIDSRNHLMAYWRDPEAHRAASRERHRRNRNAINAKRREAYAARRAA